MSTIEKAMELLNFFTVGRPEIGLSEFKRLTGRDKATTFRHLSALVSVGLLEKNALTQKYRIGPAVLRLAHQREVSMPRRAGVRLVLPELAEATGETAHASVLEGDQLFTLAHHESSAHSTRVVMHDPVLPLHATGSGIAVLAFAGDDLVRSALASMRRYTQYTLTDEAALQRALDFARSQGFGASRDAFEDGVHGIAAPLFAAGGAVAGAVAVATVSSRMNSDLERKIRSELALAARRISTSWGGSVPVELDRIWTSALSEAA